MSYNGKKIKVHKTHSIAGINPGDIITIHQNESGGKILTVNGKDYIKSWANHYWSIPVYGNGEWEIIGEDNEPKAPYSEITIGAIVILAIGSSKYIGKFKGEFEGLESKFELIDWLGLPYLDRYIESGEVPCNGGRFSTFVRYATLDEVEKYNKIIGNKEAPYVKGDVVILDTMTGIKYIGQYINTDSYGNIICNPWTGYKSGVLDSRIELHDGGFKEIIRKATVSEVAFFNSLLDKVKASTITSFTNNEGKLIKNGDIVKNNEVQGEIYIAKNDTERKIAGSWSAEAKGNIAWILGISGADNCPSCPGKPAWILMSWEVAALKLVAPTGSKEDIKVESKITSFTNDKGIVFNNGDYVGCVGGKGKLYIAKNKEEKALYDNYDDAYPVFWVLGVEGMDNCPIDRGPSWIVNSYQVWHEKEEQEVYPSAEERLRGLKYEPSEMEMKEHYSDRVEAMRLTMYASEYQSSPERGLYIGGIDPYKTDDGTKLDIWGKAKIKHQNPILVGKTKKKRFNLVIITK